MADPDKSVSHLEQISPRAVDPALGYAALHNPQNRAESAQPRLGFLNYPELEAQMLGAGINERTAMQVWGYLFDTVRGAKGQLVAWQKEQSLPEEQRPPRPGLRKMRPSEAALNLMLVQGDEPLPNDRQKRNRALRERGIVNIDYLAELLGGISGIGPVTEPVLQTIIDTKERAAKRQPPPED